MDITDATERRFEAGIQFFLEGKAITYNDVGFWKDGEKALHVDSFSEWDIENSDPQMAKEKIARAKSVLNELAEKSPEFAKVAAHLPHEHYFCSDYGKGSVALAKEKDGTFSWLA